MCGRYAAARDSVAMIQVLDDMGITIAEVDDRVSSVAPSFNVAPTREGLAVVAPRPADAGEGDRSSAVGEEASSAGDTAGRLAALSWGLVPTWAKDRRVGSRMINARVETVADKSAFATLLRVRRCLVPADGWFEWHKGVGGKQPYFVHPTVDPALMFAGLYTWWRDPHGTPDPQTDALPWFGSYTILTTAASPDLAWLHDRMPVVLSRDSCHEWLGGGRLDDHEARHLLARTVAAGGPDLSWHRVDRRVGAVANDDPSLVEPLAEAALNAPDDVLELSLELSVDPRAE